MVLVVPLRMECSIDLASRWQLLKVPVYKATSPLVLKLYQTLQPYGL